ncbi:hypothetical protein ACFLVG_03200 [Chloroflexota bacterium]
MLDLEFKLPEKFDLGKTVEWSPAGDKYLILVLDEECAESLGKALIAGKERVVIETALVDYKTFGRSLPKIWCAQKIC